MPKRKKKKSRGIIILLIFIAFIGMILPGKRGLLNQFRVYREKQALKAEIKILEESKAKLVEKKKKLQEPETVDKIAREEYGMAGEDEDVYRVVPQENENAE